MPLEKKNGAAGYKNIGISGGYIDGKRGRAYFEWKFGWQQGGLNLNDWTKRIGWKKGSNGVEEKEKNGRRAHRQVDYLKRAAGSKACGEGQMNFRSPVSLPNSVLAKLKIARKQ